MAALSPFKLNADSMILGVADELIAEHAKYLTESGLVIDLQTLQGRLAHTLELIVRYVREDCADGR